MLKEKKFIIASALLVLVGIVLFSVYRYRNANLGHKTVGLCVESDVLRNLMFQSKVSPGKNLAKLKESGINGVVLSEWTLHDLVENRYAVVNYLGESEGYLFQFFMDEFSVNNFFEVLQVKFGSVVERKSGNSIQIKGIPYADIKRIGLGFNKNEIDDYKRESLLVVGRVLNESTANEESITKTVHLMKYAGVDYYLPEGEVVLGDKNSLLHVADLLDDNGIGYLCPEFTKISGDKELLREMLEKGNNRNVAKIHSVLPLEMSRLSYSAAIERYVKSVKERGVRMLLIRPFSMSNVDSTEAFSGFVTKIKNRLDLFGYKVGVPSSLCDKNVGMLGGVFTTWLSSIVCLLIFSILLYIAMYSISSTYANVLSVGVMVMLFSIVWGMFHYLLHHTSDYVYGVKLISGVKLAHIVPLGFVFIALVDKFKLWTYFKNNPVYPSQLVGAFLFIGLLGYMLLRSGNEGVNTVSGMELYLRNFIDSTFGIRPRIKEIFFGYPVLFAGFWLFVQSDKIKRLNWLKLPASILITLGSIVFVSIYNTFSHIHTPLEVSVLRSILGVIFGGIVGLGLVGILKLIFPALVRASRVTE